MTGRALYLFVPLALAAAAIGFTWESLQPPPADALAPVAEQPRYAITNAQWVRLGRSGQPEFRAAAERIEYFADDSVRMHAVTLDAMGGLTSPWHVTAREGMAPPRERRLELIGDVVAQGRYTDTQPVVFLTERLWVDLLRRELRTDAPVQIRSDLRNASARGMRADFSGDRVELLHDVQVDYAPKS